MLVASDGQLRGQFAWLGSFQSESAGMSCPPRTAEPHLEDGNALLLYPRGRREVHLCIHTAIPQHAVSHAKQASNHSSECTSLRTMSCGFQGSKQLQVPSR